MKGMTVPCAFLMSLLAACNASSEKALSKEEFDSIQLGSSYHQVVEALGSPGEPVPARDGKHLRAFSWPAAQNGGSAVIVFEKGKAIEKIPPAGW